MILPRRSRGLLFGARGALGALGALATLAATACSSAAPSPPPAPATPPPGDAGPASACPPGEVANAQGACAGAGVPTGGCGAGFQSDGMAACAAILPASCPKGQMAVPGEASCHAVGTCGAGQWADVAADADAQFIDASFTGPASDGTRLAPWKTIQMGIDAARPGAIIAIAAGKYVENVSITKPLVVRGKCAGEVQLAGTAQKGAIYIGLGADGTEIHGLALQGEGPGMLVGGATKIVIEDVQVHDTKGYGIIVSNGTGAAEVTLRRSLIETSTGGLVAFGGTVTLDRSVVRDIAAADDPALGRCVSVQAYTGERGRMTVTSSVLERCYVGIHAAGTDLTVEATEIRDTLTRGIGIQPGDDDSRSTATIRTTVIERAREIGLAAFGGDLTLDRLVVSGLQAGTNDYGGTSVWIQYDKISKQNAKASITASTFQDGRETGVANYGADVTLTSTLIRRVQPQVVDGSFGDGLLVTRYVVDATSTLAGLRVESAARAAVSNFGATIAMSSTTLECNGIDLNGEEEGKPFAFDNTGGNTCGCKGSSTACQVQSTALKPPKALER